MPDRPDNFWPRLLLLAVILLAAGLRLWHLPGLPPGLYFDEAFNGLDARRLLETGGLPPLFFSANSGREPLYIYWQALFVWLLGPKAYALRLASAFAGIVTIPVFYSVNLRILRLLLGADTSAAQARCRWLALIGCGALAVSFWHLSLSRLGFRAVLLPPISALALAAFAEAWATGRPAKFRRAGLWLALALYTYTAARVLPATVLAFVAGEGLLWLLSSQLRRRQVPPWPGRLRGLGWMAAVGLLCALPLLLTLLGNPALLSNRTEDLSLFSARTPGTADSTGLDGLLANSRAVAGSFFTRGDGNLRHNLPGRPFNDPLQALLFLLGAGWLLLALRRPTARLALLWLGGMSLPTVLSIEAPHSLRAVGMLPPLAICYALGAQGLLRGRRMGAGLLLGLVLLISGGWTVRDYFGRWAGAPGLAETFDARVQAQAAQAQAWLRSQPNQPLLLTRELFISPQMQFAIGQLPRWPLPPGQPVPAAALANARLVTEPAPAPGQSLFLLWQPEGKQAASWLQPSPVVAQHAPEGTPGQTPVPLPPGTHLTGRQIRYPLPVTFANRVELVGYDLTPDVVPGGSQSQDTNLSLTTFWRVPAGLSYSAGGDFAVFAHLILPDRRIRVNGGLGNGKPVPLWLPGPLVEDVRTFSVPADTPPGWAFFELGLFRREPDGAIERIGIRGADGTTGTDQLEIGAIAIGTVAIGTVAIEAADRPHPEGAAPGPDVNVNPLGVVFDERIELVGWRLLPGDGASDELAVALAWRARDRSPTDYKAFVHLLDAGGEIFSQHDIQLESGGVRTSLWPPGATSRAVFRLQTPPADGAGSPQTHRLRIGLYEPVSRRQLPITSGPVLSAGAGAVDAGPQVEATFLLLPVPVPSGPE